MKFNVTQEEFKKAVNSKQQKEWFRNELHKFDKNISKIKIRDDVDQALVHKYDSPNKDQLKGNEDGYYVLDDSNQSNNDCSDVKYYFINDNGEKVEIKNTNIRSRPISWEQYKEANK